MPQPAADLAVIDLGDGRHIVMQHKDNVELSGASRLYLLEWLSHVADALLVGHAVLQDKYGHNCKKPTPLFGWLHTKVGRACETSNMDQTEPTNQ